MMFINSFLWKRLYLEKLALEQATFEKVMYLEIGQQVYKELVGILLSTSCPVLLLQSIDTQLLPPVLIALLP